MNYLSDVTLNNADCITQCGYHSFIDVNLNGVMTRIQIAIAANPALKASCLCSIYSSNSESPNGNFAADGKFIDESSSTLTLLRHGQHLRSRDRRGRHRHLLRLVRLRLPRERRQVRMAVPRSPGYQVSLNRCLSLVCMANDLFPRPGNLGLANMKVGPTMSFAIQAVWLNYGQGCCSMQWPVQCPYETCC